MITKKSEIMRPYVEKCLFLAKNTVHIGNYLRPTHKGFVVAFSGENLDYQTSNISIHDSNSTKSSKAFFSVFRDSYRKTILKNKLESIWTYEPYEWIHDLKYTQVKTYCNSYYLFRRYSNKVNQLRQLLEYGSSFLRFQIRSQIRKFDDTVSLNSKAEGWLGVCYQTPHSEAGRGISLASSKDNFSSLRTSKLCDYTMGVSQAGTVFKDGVIMSAPARVWNGAYGHRFSWCCAFYDPKISDYIDTAFITQLSREIGLCLSAIGYRGAFGVDYLVDEDTGEVFIGEANLRFTGDLALFSKTTSWESTFQNPLHPHSLHILAFNNAISVDEVLVPTERYLPFEMQGGGELRCHYDPGTPLKYIDGSNGFSDNILSTFSPYQGFLSAPVTL